jgi:carboxymethylenebutenolidase
MFETETRVTTPDGEVTTFIAHPDGEGPFPVAVLFMDGIGYREQVKANARRFAEGGYYVVAPDFFYRSGDGVTFGYDQIATPEGRAELFDAIGRVPPDRAISDVEAVLDAIADDPAAADGPKVCVGYCMGARLSLRAASAMPDDFVAAAGIHPGALVNDNPDSPHLEAATVRAELYFAFAETDASATADNVERLREALEEQGVKATIERLPGTQHGFAMADLPVYDEGAAERHFERTLDLWRRNLAQEPVGV